MICSSPQSAKRHGVQLHDDSVSTMNRFNLLKARTRANIYQIFVLLFFLLAPQAATAVHYTAPVPCTAEQQNKIMNYSQHTSCQARDTVIDLKAFVANMSDVIHIVPDVALVKRCGGNCIRPSHRCISITKQKKMIPIMMIMPRFPHGNHNSVCGNIEIDEDVECGCGCPIRPEDCHRARIGDLNSQHVPEKYFDSASCRCLCRNTEQRHECITSGMDWDESTCRCRCPLSRWQHCSTGYVFDFENSCRCVPTSMTASLGLIAALIVLIVCILVTAVGFFTMYRRQTGLFRQSRRNRIVRENQLLRKNEIPELKSQNLRNYDLFPAKELSPADKQ